MTRSPHTTRNLRPLRPQRTSPWQLDQHAAAETRKDGAGAACYHDELSALNTMKSPENLYWIDLEMTGLKPEFGPDHRDCDDRMTLRVIPALALRNNMRVTR